MDMEYTIIIQKLNNNYHKAPDLIKIWKYYLKIKKENFIKSLQQCEMMLQQLETTPIMDIQTIALLYIINTANR